MPRDVPIRWERNRAYQSMRVHRDVPEGLHEVWTGYAEHGTYTIYHLCKRPESRMKPTVHSHYTPKGGKWIGMGGETIAAAMDDARWHHDRTLRQGIWRERPLPKPETAASIPLTEEEPTMAPTKKPATKKPTKKPAAKTVTEANCERIAKRNAAVARRVAAKPPAVKTRGGVPISLPKPPEEIGYMTMPMDGSPMELVVTKPPRPVAVTGPKPKPPHEPQQLGLLKRGLSREAFVAYLRETLIPDLIEMGNVHTAEDFETAIHFIEHEDA